MSSLVYRPRTTQQPLPLPGDCVHQAPIRAAWHVFSCLALLTQHIKPSAAVSRLHNSCTKEGHWTRHNLAHLQFPPDSTALSASPGRRHRVWHQGGTPAPAASRPPGQSAAPPGCQRAPFDWAAQRHGRRAPGGRVPLRTGRSASAGQMTWHHSCSANCRASSQIACLSLTQNPFSGDTLPEEATLLPPAT